MQIRRLTTTTTSTSVQSEHCTVFLQMRTAPPWLQHRDLNLCHDLSHYLFQTCLIHNSAPHTASHPTTARSFIVLVTPFPLCHHHQTTLSFSPIVTRSFVTVPNRRRLDGDPPHPFLFRCTTRTQLCCFNSVSPSAAPADLTTSVFQFVIVRKLHTHFLHVAILSGPLFVEGHVDIIVTPELGFVQVSSHRHL